MARKIPASLPLHIPKTIIKGRWSLRICKSGSSVFVNLYSHDQSGSLLLVNMVIRPNGLTTIWHCSDMVPVDIPERFPAADHASVTDVPL